MTSDWHAEAIALTNVTRLTSKEIAEHYGVSIGAVDYALGRSATALGDRVPRPGAGTRAKRVRSEAYRKYLRDYARKRRAARREAAN